jgi:hypothetical protein
LTARRGARWRTVAVTTAIDVDRWSAFGLLSDLDEHSRFAGDFVDVLALDGPSGARAGGLLRIRGPLGIRRVVSTRLVAARAPMLLSGQATAGPKTTARISWRLARCSSGTTVELSVTVLRATVVDRVLLSLGRAWLRRQLAGTLRRFAVAAAGSDVRRVA